MEELETTFAKTLTLTAVEAEGVVLEEDEDMGHKEVLERSLLAKLYTKKPFHCKSLKESLLERWNPKGRVEIKEIGGDLFMFTFRLLEDKMRAIHYGPWTFDKALILLEEPADAVTVQSIIHLHHADFWVAVS